MRQLHMCSTVCMPAFLKLVVPYVFAYINMFTVSKTAKH